ncbi:unnamed protein product [Calypogeia fissa]
MVGKTSASLCLPSTSFCSDISVSSLQNNGGKVVTYSQRTTQSIVLPLHRDLLKVCIRNSQHSATRIRTVGCAKTNPGGKYQVSNPLKLCSSQPELKQDHADDQKINFPFYAAISNLFCDALENVLLWAFYGSRKPVNYYMLGNYAPVEESAPQPVLLVKGYLPECLNGEYIQVGPNAKFMPVAKYHWFDGDGMLHGLKIRDGEVTYACRYVRTSRLKQEEYWGAPKFQRSGDWVGFQGVLCMGIFKLREILGVLDTSNGVGPAQTALAYHNDTLFVLCEQDMPYVVQILEDGDFKTTSRHDFDKKLDHPFTAHPKIDPDTGEMFSYGFSVEAPPSLTYNVISRDGKMSDPVHVTLSQSKVVHDFVITDDYAVFMECPLHLDLVGMVMKDQFAISHSQNTPFRFGLLPKYAKDETEMRWFEFSSAVNFHMANGWQEGNEIVLVTCRMPTVDMLRITDACARLHEYRINLKSGETSERRLGNFITEFPKINENYTGKKNQYVYSATHTHDEPRQSGIVKCDFTKDPQLCKEKWEEESLEDEGIQSQTERATVEVGGNVAGVFWHGPGRVGLEPLFVPRNAGRDSDEDDGYILCHVFDENTGKSEVIVIDAKTMSPDLVAVIEMPSRVPFRIHSLFVSEEKLLSDLGRVI